MEIKPLSMSGSCDVGIPSCHLTVRAAIIGYFQGQKMTIKIVLREKI